MQQLASYALPQPHFKCARPAAVMSAAIGGLAIPCIRSVFLQLLFSQLRFFSARFWPEPGSPSAASLFCTKKARFKRSEPSMFRAIVQVFNPSDYSTNPSDIDFTSW